MAHWLQLSCLIFVLNIQVLHADVIRLKQNQPIHQSRYDKGQPNVLKFKKNSYGQLPIRQQLAQGPKMPTFITIHGKRYSNQDNTLKMSSTYTDKGGDVLGNFVTTYYVYEAVGTNITFKTFIKNYDHASITIAGQEFPDGLPGCSVGCKECVSTGYPVLSMNSTSEETGLGFLSYGFDFLGDKNKVLGLWGDPNDMRNISSGVESGPLIIFNEMFQMTQMITSFEEFMGGAVQYDLTKKTASWGIIGSMEEVPKNYKYSVLVIESIGIKKTWEFWGSIMSKVYNRDTTARDQSVINNYLGYSTDNGAYYYYLTENGTTYEETILEIYKYSKQQKLPYRYIQYDSWWYYQGPIRAVYNWSARADVFPHGAKYLWSQHNWPILAHNRFWSNESVYAKQNGGKFDFIIEKDNMLGLPQDEEFWDYLFKQGLQWGLETYLQDWLNVQSDQMNVTNTDIRVLKRWLMQMGRSASKLGINIFYCMAPSRHAMQSLEIPAVATARVSDDHQPGNERWRIGITTHFAHALGLAPTKDTWWSTREQPGNPYNLTEDHPALESLVATLSAGPVAPGDKIGYSDAQLIMRCCNEDGLILKPSVPVRAISEQIIQTAFHNGPLSEGAEVWSTHSNISGHQFGVILAVDLKGSYDITPSKAEFGSDFEKSHIYKSFTSGSLSTQEFSDVSPYTLSECTKDLSCLLYTTPVFTSRNGTELLLLGEAEKWVNMSPKRVTSIIVTQWDAVIEMRGAVGEKINFYHIVVGDTHPQSNQCVFGQTGVVELHIFEKDCRQI